MKSKEKEQSIFEGVSQFMSDIFGDIKNMKVDMPSYPFKGDTQYPITYPIKEKRDGYEVMMDVPGYDTTKLDVWIKDTELLIKYEASDQEKKENPQVESFEQKIKISEYDECQDIDAVISHGVLKIFIPKPPSKTPKKVKISELQ